MRAGLLWRLARPVLGPGQNPGLRFLFSREVTNVGIRTNSGFYRDEPTPAFCHFRFERRESICHRVSMACKPSTCHPLTSAQLKLSAPLQMLNATPTFVDCTNRLNRGQRIFASHWGAFMRRQIQRAACDLDACGAHSISFQISNGVGRFACCVIAHARPISGQLGFSTTTGSASKRQRVSVWRTLLSTEMKLDL